MLVFDYYNLTNFSDSQQQNHPAFAAALPHSSRPPVSISNWSAVDFEPYKPLSSPFTLADVRKHPALQKMQLVRKSRISVVPVTEAEFSEILAAAKTKAR